MESAKKLTSLMEIHEIRFKKAIKEIRERVNCQYLDLIPITEGMNSKIYKISTKEDGIEIKYTKFLAIHQNKMFWGSKRRGFLLINLKSHVPNYFENKREEWIY